MKKFKFSGAGLHGDVTVAEVDQWRQRRPEFTYSQKAKFTERCEIPPWSVEARVRAEHYTPDGSRKRVAPSEKAGNKAARKQRERANKYANKMHVTSDVELTSQHALWESREDNGCISSGRR